MSPDPSVMARFRPGMLPFPADLSGDEAARKFVGENVHRPRVDAWAALYAPERVAQTVRVLKAILMNVRAQSLDRRADVSDAMAEYVAGKITEEVLVGERAEFDDWKARSSRFRASTVERLNEALAELKKHNVRESRRKIAADEQVFRDLLAKLVQSVRTHQLQTEAAGLADAEDRLLWARLDLMLTPSGHPIRDLVKRQGLNRNMSEVLSDAMDSDDG